MKNKHKTNRTIKSTILRKIYEKAKRESEKRKIIKMANQKNSSRWTVDNGRSINSISSNHTASRKRVVTKIRKKRQTNKHTRR